jgi:sulfite reductase alpha subunit-like flavoprotein
MTTRTEEIYVLYASQTKKSENAATSFAEEITTKLSPEAIQELTGSKDEITVVPTLMVLDEFLELKAWKRLCVIFVSSHGRGDAPKGGFRFRDLCETWKDLYEQEKDHEKMLSGVQYALCGLGDSSFKTYLENPTTLDEGLQSAGAQRVGPLGKADARGRLEDAQANVIERWKEGIWKPLADAIVQEPLSEEKMNEISNTVASMKY